MGKGDLFNGEREAYLVGKGGLFGKGGGLFGRGGSLFGGEGVFFWWGMGALLGWGGGLLDKRGLCRLYLCQCLQ